MAHDAAIHDEAFADAVRRRRKNLPIRMGVGVVGALVFSPVIGAGLAPIGSGQAMRTRICRRQHPSPADLLGCRRIRAAALSIE